MKRFLVFFALALVGTTASAQDVKTAIQKRFTFERDSNGTLVNIRDDSMGKGFSLKPLVEEIRQNLVEAQKMAIEQSDKMVESAYTSPVSRTGAKMVLRNLRKVNLDTVFNHPVMQKIFYTYELKLNDALIADPNVISSPNDTTYFYRHQVTYEIMTMALNWATTALDNVPVLGVAAYVIKNAERLIRERRYFRQNMLLYYIENNKPSDLGLTWSEVQMIASSIYESRLVAQAYSESKYAKDTWTEYGGVQFDTVCRAAEKRLSMIRNQLDSVGERINCMFAYATVKGHQVILNLVDRNNKFLPVPSIAFFPASPNRVGNVRIISRLVQVAAHLLPLDSMTKGKIDQFVESTFASQRITEGGLMAYFESKNMVEEARALNRQIMNPYLAN